MKPFSKTNAYLYSQCLSRLKKKCLVDSLLCAKFHYVNPAQVDISIAYCLMHQNSTTLLVHNNTLVTNYLYP